MALPLRQAAMILCLVAGSGVASDRPDVLEPAPQDLETLMMLFAGSGGVRAQFLERRELEILQNPIETRGDLYFSPPDRLARHTRRPGQSSLVVHGNKLTLRDETGQQTLNLDSSELARGLVNNFSVLLSGDLDSLRERYEIEFSPHRSTENQEPDGWLLELKPRSRLIRSLVERIRIEGQSNRLTTMETLETNGDRSVMVFTAVETGLEFDSDELARFFSTTDQNEP